MLFNFFFLVSFGFKFDCSLSILLKALRLLEKKTISQGYNFILFYTNSQSWFTRNVCKVVEIINV